MSVCSAAFLGASGRIGRLLRGAECATDGRAVNFFWQYRAGNETDDRAFLWPDFSDAEPLLAARRRLGFDSVVIFSGASRAKEEAFAPQAHVRVLDQAIAAALEAGIHRILVASSSAVYGLGHGRPFREEDAPDPVNDYGQAKVDVERLCAGHGRAKDVEICALRIGNVAGADILLSRAMAVEGVAPPLKLDIFPDGRSPSRSYIGPKTLFDVLVELLKYDGRLPPVLNIAGSEPVDMSTLLDVAQVPWMECKVAANEGHQRILLETSRLAQLCPALKLSGGAREIVAEWQAVRNVICP